MTYLVYIILVIIILCLLFQFFIWKLLLSRLGNVSDRLSNISQKLEGLECFFSPLPSQDEAEIDPEERKFQEEAERAYAQGVSNILSYDIGKGLLAGE